METEKVLMAALCMTRQCWEQGMLSYALMLGNKNQLLELMVHDMVIRQSSDGRLCNVENTPAVTDSAFCIPAVLQSGCSSRNPEYTAAAEKNIKFLLYDAERAQDGTLFHIKGTEEIWADSAAFLPYALSIAGHPEDAMRQMEGILRRLYLPATGLYAHIWDDAAKDFPDRRAWGIGNGWILTGLLRTLLTFPPKSQEREKLESEFTTLLECMTGYMTSDGRFHDVLDDPDTYLETETACMTACAIMRAVKTGILSNKWQDMAFLIRKAVLAQTDDRGMVLQSSGSPSFEHPGTSVESQAHVILMEQLYQNSLSDKEKK